MRAGTKGVTSLNGTRGPCRSYHHSATLSFFPFSFFSFFFFLFFFLFPLPCLISRDRNCTGHSTPMQLEEEGKANTTVITSQLHQVSVSSFFPPTLFCFCLFVVDFVVIVSFCRCQLLLLSFLLSPLYLFLLTLSMTSMLYHHVICFSKRS